MAVGRDNKFPRRFDAGGKFAADTGVLQTVIISPVGVHYMTDL